MLLDVARHLFTLLCLGCADTVWPSVFFIYIHPSHTHLRPATARGKAQFLEPHVHVHHPRMWVSYPQTYKERLQSSLGSTEKGKALRLLVPPRDKEHCFLVFGGTVFFSPAISHHCSRAKCDLQFMFSGIQSQLYHILRNCSETWHLQFVQPP